MRPTGTTLPPMQRILAAITLPGAFAAAGFGMYGTELPPVLRIAGMVVALAITCLGFLALTRKNRRLAAELDTAGQIACQQAGIIALALNETDGGAGGWLWETDAAGRIVNASDGLSKSLGCPADILRGRRFADLFDADGSGTGWHRLLLALETGQAIDCTVELPLHGNRTWWQIRARPSTCPEGRFAGHRGIAFDITAERLARLRLTEERDLASRESARKSHFITTMGQELRAPLNTLVGFGEHMLSPHALDLGDAERREHLQTMLDTSRDLQALIADVLDIARIEKGALQLLEQEADAAEITEVAMKMCREAAARSGVTIIASVIDGIELRCDVSRIKQALVNMVTSAVVSSSRGCAVQVEFETPDDGRLAIAVSSSGTTLNSEQLRRIFEPYMQGGHNGGYSSRGMGLGLPIARHIALRHGGDVTIEAADGAGTVARLILPAARVTWPVEALQDFCAA